MQGNAHFVPNHLLHHREYRVELEERQHQVIAEHNQAKQERTFIRNMIDRAEMLCRVRSIVAY